MVTVADLSEAIMANKTTFYTVASQNAPKQDFKHRDESFKFDAQKPILFTGCNFQPLETYATIFQMIHRTVGYITRELDLKLKNYSQSNSTCTPKEYYPEARIEDVRLEAIKMRVRF